MSKITDAIAHAYPGLQFSMINDDPATIVWADKEQALSSAQIAAAVEDFDKAQRRREIIAELADIDLKSIRPLRAGEGDKVQVLDDQAAALRAELAAL